jgi:hypothetical protein
MQLLNNIHWLVGIVAVVFIVVGIVQQLQKGRRQ